MVIKRLSRGPAPAVKPPKEGRGTYRALWTDGQCIAEVRGVKLAPRFDTSAEARAYGLAVYRGEKQP